MTLFKSIALATACVLTLGAVPAFAGVCPAGHEGVDLRKPDAIFVETRGARKQLMQPATDDPNGPKRPMEVGDVLELNERRAVVVGIAETRPSFRMGSWRRITGSWVHPISAAQEREPRARPSAAPRASAPTRVRVRSRPFMRASVRTRA
jgi:hypothetical protein